MRSTTVSINLSTRANGRLWQTEIACQGRDLGGVMQLVSQRAATLCRSDGGVAELAEGHEVVYRAAAGPARAQLGLRRRRGGSLSGL
jgi:hypothetical protein